MGIESKQRILVLGVALEGSTGSPAVVFRSASENRFLALNADPFEAETIIREFTGEGDSSAVAWLAGILGRRKPCRAHLLMEEGRSWIVFQCLFRRKRRLALGEGLALIHRLSVPLTASEELFQSSAQEMAYLGSRSVFSGDFLYLTPPQYAPNIPLV